MKTFSKYEHIWLEDKHLYLNRFLNECKQNCFDEDEDNAFAADMQQIDPNTQTNLFQIQVNKNYMYQRKKNNER